jgi:hypothetical protein
MNFKVGDFDGKIPAFAGIVCDKQVVERHLSGTVKGLKAAAISCCRQSLGLTLRADDNSL